MKKIHTFLIAILLSSGLFAQLENWTNDYQITPNASNLYLLSVATNEPTSKQTVWTDVLEYQYQGTQSKVKLLLPPGVTKVSLTAQSNTFQNGPDILTQSPVFGLFRDWDIGQFCNSWDPNDCNGTGESFVSKADMHTGSPLLSLTVENLESNLLRYIPYTQHNPAAGLYPFEFSTDGSLVYIITDTLLYNTWYNEGMPFPESCTDFDAGYAGDDIVLCENEEPNVLNSTPAIGYGNSFLYQWQYTTDVTCDTCWVDIDGETNMAYNPPQMPVGEYWARRYVINACGGTYTEPVKLTVETCSDISNVVENEFNVYPNPASTYVIIESEKLKGENLQILDITGKVVKHFKINNSEFRIQIENLDNGVYFIKARTQVQKFIKE